MNNKSKYLIKNVGILTISNFASKIMIFLLVPLYTSILSTEEYGKYDLVFTTVQLLFPLLTLNIVDAIMRFSMDKAYSINDIATIGIRYYFRSLIPVGVFSFISSQLDFVPIIKGYELIVFLYFSFYVLNQFCIQFSKGLEKVIDMGIAGLIGTAVLIAGNIYFLIYMKNGLKGFFIANILSQAIPCLYFLFRIKPWKYCKSLKINASLQREMLIYCLPLIFTTLCWWVNNASDRYIVALLCGTVANGILSVSYKIPSILNVFQQIFIQAWQISAIKEYGEEGTKRFYGNTFLYLNLFMSCVCSILIISSKPIAHLLYANDFYAAWQYVPFLLLASLLNSASGFLGPILLAKKDSKNMAKSALFGAGANLILNIFLTLLIGVQGAAIATALASFVIYIVRKNAANDMIKIESYSIVYITWGILCFQSMIEIMSWGYLIEFLCLFIILIINIKNIKGFFSVFKIFGKNNH